MNKQDLQFKILGIYYSNSLSVKEVVRNYKINSKDFISDLTQDEKDYAEQNMSLKIEDNVEKNEMVSNLIQVLSELSSIKTFDDESVDKSLIEKLKDVINYMQI